MAPPEQWPAIERTFREWAKDNQFRPVAVCRHIPQGPHFIAVDPDWPHLMILDVKKIGTWRGSTLIDHHMLLEVSRVSDSGFRRIRPGAEGVIKLVLNGAKKGGRPNWEALEAKGVSRLLSSDPEGVVEASEWFGRLNGSLLVAVDAYLNGQWDRRAMLALESRAALRAVLEPATAISRLVFNNFTIPRCQVLRSIRSDDRRIPKDSARWFTEVASNHEIDMAPGYRD